MKNAAEKIKSDLCRYGKPLLAVLAVILLLNVFSGSICPFRKLWGIPCPSCGITRAAMLLLEGKFREAFLMHGFIYVLPVLAVLGIAERYFVNAECKVTKKVLYITAALALLYYAYRMIVYFPDQEPMIFYKDSVLGKLLNFC